MTETNGTETFRGLESFSTEDLLKALNDRKLEPEHVDELKQIILSYDKEQTDGTNNKDVVKSDKTPEQLGKQYAESVKTWAIYGYHPPLVIDGKSYSPSFEFCNKGETEEILDTSDENKSQSIIFARMMTRISHNNQFPPLHYGEFIKSMYVSVTDMPQHMSERFPGKKLILINIFHSMKKTTKNRQDVDAAPIALVVPDEIADDFEKNIREKPDLIKSFYQEALPGMDSQGGSEGLDRLVSERIIYITQEQLKHVSAGHKENPVDQNLYLSDETGLAIFLRSCETIEFKNGAMR